MNVLVLDDEPYRHEAFAKRFKNDSVWHVYSFEQFRRALHTNIYDLICFDHDLGERLNGNDAAKFLISSVPSDRWPTKCLVHSWNPEGGVRIERTLRAAGIEVERWMFNTRDVAGWDAGR